MRQEKSLCKEGFKECKTTTKVKKIENIIRIESEGEYRESVVQQNKAVGHTITGKQCRTLGGRRGAQGPPPIIFTEGLVLKSGSTRKFLF